MLICVLRHGEAEAQSSDGRDSSRRLTATGHLENRRVAGQLRGLGIEFAHILVSPYVRAQQTASDVLGIVPDIVPDSPGEPCALLTPDTKPLSLLEYLDLQGSANTLLIGHNPLVSRFVALLTNGGPSVDRYLGTSHLAVIETEVVAPACGVLKYYLEP